MEKKILVVDDDVMSLHLAEMFLKRGGYQVIKAADGEICLSCLRKEPVDLILLDVEMPDMSGEETLQAIREEFSSMQTPVLFLSGSETMEEELKQGRYDVQGFIKKPFIPANLLQTVQKILSESEMKTND